jgi:hypothetical protein
MATAPKRTALDPPLPTGQGDLLDRTARQVRLPRGPVHQLNGQPYTIPQLDRFYRTECDRLLLGMGEQAMLTTHPADCVACHAVAGPAEQSVAELVEAGS